MGSEFWGGFVRLTALDGIRGLFFLFVFSVHLEVPGVSGGGIGVEVFFTLSGFLITTLVVNELEKTGRLDFKRFYIRRILRLGPAMMLVVGAVLVGAYFGFRHSPEMRHETLRGIPYVVTYTSNWLRAAPGHATLGALGHTWSLAVEEQFYLIWPLLLVIGFRLAGRRGIAVISLIGVVIPVFLRFYFIHKYGHGDRLHTLDRVYFGTDTQTDQLLIGAFLAVTVQRAEAWYRRWSKYLIVPAIAYMAWAICFPRSPEYRFTWGLLFVALCSTVLITYLLLHNGSRLERLFSWKPLSELGLISYGAYLWHQPVHRFMPQFTSNRPLFVIVVFIITIILAVLSFRIVERPIMRWRNNRQKLKAPLLEVQLGNDSASRG